MTRFQTLAIAALLAAAPFAAPSRAASPYRVPVHFAYTNDAGVGYSWFVVGSHPDVGYRPPIGEQDAYWDVLRAAPLAWHEGNIWSADIGIQAGTELKYKFIKRPIDAAEYPDGNNTEWMAGDNLSLSVPAEPDAPGKRVVFLCDWPEPVELWYSMLDTANYDATNGWNVTTMKKTGDARYELDGVGEAGRWMRFTFRQPDNDWWYHYYQTEADFWSPLDAFCIRDGQVFDYEPVPTDGGWVSDSQIISTNVYSTAEGIDGREIRIFLPRGYNENTNRRYPVVYFSDGQNVFHPGGSFGCWYAESAADREIRGGRMREAILVAVPCRETPPDGAPDDYAWAGRLWEYLPGTDVLTDPQGRLPIALPGLGEHYADFLIHNVKPTLDYNFRTLPDRENTAHIGSSAGGLLSLYLGTAFGDVFGLVAPMSGVYNEEYIPKFRQWCLEHPDAVAKPKRVWLDTGTEETSIDGLNLYESNWDALRLLLYAGHVPNKSLHFGVYSGWQGEHNEPAWAQRIDEVFDFLLPVTDEVNPLRRPEIRLDGLKMDFQLYGGAKYDVMRAESLLEQDRAQSVWSTPAAVDRPWTNASYTVGAPGFYWIEGK